ncbi:hypothetical protein NBRC116493_03840 [Aurantivibrio infirmus]
MSQVVVATHDYGHGGVGMLVRCENPDELAFALGASWKVVSEKVKENAYYKHAVANGEVIYDFSNPDGLLARMLKISLSQSQGKKAFPIRVGSNGNYASRYVWARSAEEIKSKFPSCEFLYGQVLTEPLRESDIDVPDDFIDKYGK